MCASHPYLKTNYEDSWPIRIYAKRYMQSRCLDARMKSWEVAVGEPDAQHKTPEFIPQSEADGPSQTLAFSRPFFPIPPCEKSLVNRNLSKLNAVQAAMGMDTARFDQFKVRRCHFSFMQRLDCNSNQLSIRIFTTKYLKHHILWPEQSNQDRFDFTEQVKLNSLHFRWMSLITPLRSANNSHIWRLITKSRGLSGFMHRDCWVINWDTGIARNLTKGKKGMQVSTIQQLIYKSLFPSRFWESMTWLILIKTSTTWGSWWNLGKPDSEAWKSVGWNSSLFQSLTLWCSFS